MWITELWGCAQPEPRTPAPPWKMEAGECPGEPVGDVQGGLQVRLVGQWDLAVTSGSILAELDGDPCVELLVGEGENPNLPGYYSTSERYERISLVEAPRTDGLVGDVGLRVLENEFQQYLGAWTMVWDSSHGELITGAGDDYSETSAYHLERGRTLGPFDREGLLDRGGDDGYGHLHSAWSTRQGPLLVGLATQALDLSFDGRASFYPLPVRNERTVRDVLSQIEGLENEQMHTLETRFPFVGGPTPDLAFGVFEGFGGRGGVALVDHLVPGYHKVWDVAVTTIEGEGGELGYGLGGGDLDGDGHPDLLVGAATFEDTGRAYGFAGPLPAGALTVADADWTFTSDDVWSLTGAALTVGDFDGDGVPDLALAQPHNWNFSEEPGAVALFRGPVPQGTIAVSDADRVVRSIGPTASDDFGRPLLVGDLDGDGIDDLVITAIDDVDDRGRTVGSVQILYGHPTVFDPP